MPNWSGHLSTPFGVYPRIPGRRTSMSAPVITGRRSSFEPIGSKSVVNTCCRVSDFLRNRLKLAIGFLVSDIATGDCGIEFFRALREGRATATENRGHGAKYRRRIRI